MPTTTATPLVEVTVMLVRKYMHSAQELIPVLASTAALHTEWQSSYSGILMGIMPEKHIPTLQKMPEIQSVLRTGTRYYI